MDEDVKGNQVGLIKLGNANYLAIGSFFNHSCAPNTCRINAGDATVLVATRNIAAGEEIGDIYSMHYSENNTKQGMDLNFGSYVMVALYRDHIVNFYKVVVRPLHFYHVP